MKSLSPTELRTDRLTLTPLAVVDAADMVGVLADAELYMFTGGNPPTLTELESRYRSQVAGSGDDELWLNWILRLRESGIAVGFVQTTIIGNAADVAWVVGLEWQGQRLAIEGVAAMCRWLEGRGINRLVAHIHPQHAASAGVAAAVGLSPTDEIDSDGEAVWATPAR